MYNPEYLLITVVCICSNLGVFGEVLGSITGFTGEDMAECMMYRKRTWKGVLPVNHLAQWAADKQVSLLHGAASRQASAFLSGLRHNPRCFL